MTTEDYDKLYRFTLHDQLGLPEALPARGIPVRVQLRHGGYASAINAEDLCWSDAELSVKNLSAQESIYKWRPFGWNEALPVFDACANGRRNKQ